MTSRSANNPGFGMMLAAAVGLLALLTWFFAGVVDDRANPNRQVQSQVVNGAVVVMLEADRQGHFVATGQINGQDVRFLVDTGATLVSVPESLADRLGLERSAPIRLETAGGTVQGWMTRLEEVRLGEIVQHDVPAAINPGRHESVLLGMSFLRDLEMTQRRGELRLVAE